MKAYFSVLLATMMFSLDARAVETKIASALQKAAEGGALRRSNP